VFQAVVCIECRALCDSFIDEKNFNVIKMRGTSFSTVYLLCLQMLLSILNLLL